MFRNYFFVSSMRPFRKAEKASCKVSAHSSVAVSIHGNLKAFLVVFFFFVTGFFFLVPFVTGWMSRLRRFWCEGTLSVPTAQGKWKALYHPQSRRGFRDSFSVSSSHASGYIPYLCVISCMLLGEQDVSWLHLISTSQAEREKWSNVVKMY